MKSDNPSEHLNQLPKGWVWTRIGDACIELIGGGTPSRDILEYFGGNIVWLTPTEVPKNKIVILNDSKEKITELGLRKSSAKIIPKDSVLLTSRASIGFVAISGCEVTTNQGFASFVCSNAIYNFFLAYWLRANKDMLESNATGTTFKEISKSKLRKLYIPLPPLPEQKRIVAKIEELFTKLDTGVEALKKIKTQLKRYRQSVLKSAFEGKLIRVTSKWIEETLIECCEKVTDGSHFTPEYISEGYPFVTIRNRKENKIDFDSCKRISKKDFEALKKNDCNPLKGDILFSKDGTVGEVIEIDYDKEFIVLSSWAIIRPKKIIIQHYLKWFLKSDLALSQATELKTGTAITRIVLKNLKKVRIKFPESKKEQEKIVKEIERRFSVADEVEKAVEQGLKQSERLRQSILKRAFEGKLVPQDPTDEPAEKLLMRIKKEQTKREADKKKGKNKINMKQKELM